MIIGIGFNSIGARGIPWIKPPSGETAAGFIHDGSNAISLGEAKMLYDAGIALFLDARDYNAFQQGHLPGARNIPIREAESRIPEIKEMIDAGMIGITYCHDVECGAAVQLADILRAHGLSSVRPLINGWTDWVNTGYPVESGG
jgi:ArsR family transcriptional regulator